LLQAQQKRLCETCPSILPEIKKHLLVEKGQIRSFRNIFVCEDDIRDLENQKNGALFKRRG